MDRSCHSGTAEFAVTTETTKDGNRIITLGYRAQNIRRRTTAIRIGSVAPYPRIWRVSNPALGTTDSCARRRERDLVDPPARFEMLR